MCPHYPLPDTYDFFKDKFKKLISKKVPHYPTPMTFSKTNSRNSFQILVAAEAAAEVARLSILHYARRSQKLSGIVHVTGPVIKVNGRIIQRCALCGVKICDSKNTAMPTEPDGSIPIFPTWESGVLIEEDGNRWSLIPDSNQLPDNSCMQFIED